MVTVGNILPHYPQFSMRHLSLTKFKVGFGPSAVIHFGAGWLTISNEVKLLFYGWSSNDVNYSLDFAVAYVDDCLAL